MAHGVSSVLKRPCKSESGGKGIGSRRIFAPHFKLQVLDSYRNDADCKGNQRATARKYGIHRRQIQKWLQAENTLRNSVKDKEKASSLNGCRQPDVGIEAAAARPSQPPAHQQQQLQRVPALPPSAPAPPPPPPQVPLDFTVHNRCLRTSPNVANADSPSPPPCTLYTSPPPMLPAPTAMHCPMDLSLKKETPATFGYCFGGMPTGGVCMPLTPPPSSAGSTDSCCRDEWSSTPKSDPDVWDLSTKGQKRRCTSPPQDTKPVKLFKPYLDVIKDSPEEPIKSEPSPACPEEAGLPTCCSIPTSTDTYYFNNNYACDAECNYTLHELKPYYYYCRDYCPCDYDLAGCYYDELGYGPHGVSSVKPRQRYSLDFKLSAIDCYYQDSVCKGNQRAVANKYNIHRRQVQKWLKQAEELRTKNESMKQIHAVR
ncbi:unnamed protein product [Callosobruchus maculatus]|uniref:Brinker DNA-binding domain-containing protein n=1 Tax=Callosobruchus maculatus TaxID=64391 RepID=A0A653CIG8_CALMS|nr:unnamed protein product [Callosobruchus maculatus]